MQTITVKYIDTTEYEAYIEYDEFCDSPTTYGLYDIITDYKTVSTESGKLLPSVQAKIKAGTMFWLDKYEHGNTSWSLSSEGMQCRFDTSSKAGLIELLDVKSLTYDERKEYARDYLQEYTSWYNGEVYEVSITDNTGKDIDSICGIIGYENIDSIIDEMIPDAVNVKKIENN